MESKSTDTQVYRYRLGSEVLYYITMLKLLNILLICIAICNVSDVLSQPLYEIIDETDGLPSNRVYRTIEDHLGYIWIATEEGVCKYDGLELNCFNTNNGLVINDIYNIFEDEIGRIWMIGVGNYIQFYYQDSIYAYKTTNKGYVNHLWDQDSIQWFSNSDNIYKIDPSNELTIYTYEELENITEEPLSSYLDYRLIYKKNDKVNELLRYGMPKIIPVSSEHLISNNTVITTDLNSSINAYNYTDSIEEKKIIDINSNIGHIICQYNLQSNTYQIFHNHKTLFVLDDQTNFSDTIPIDIISEYYTNCALEDSKGNLWLSTLKGVISYHKLTRDHQIKTAKNTSHKVFTHVLNYKNGYIAATEDEEIYYFENNESSLIYKYDTDFHHSFYSVNIINDKLYFSRGPKGIKAINLIKKINHPTYINHSSNQTDEKYTINYIKKFINVDSTLYSASRGLIVHDYEKNIIHQYNKIKIQEIALNEQDSTLWTSDKDSIYIYKISENLLDAEIISTINISNIEKIIYLQNGNFLINTFSGKSYNCNKIECKEVLDTSKIIIKSFKKYDDNLYLNCNDGLYEVYIDKKQNISLNKIFDYKLLGNVNEINDFIISPTQYIFATSKGIMSATVKPYNTEKKKPLMYIEQLNDQDYSGNDQAITFPSGINKLDISYHSIIYSINKDYKYEYQLVGVDQEVRKTDQRTVSYPSPSSGNYTFKIRALDSYDNSSEWKTATIIIQYPWYRTWRAYLTYLLLFSLIVWWISSWYRKRLIAISKTKQAYSELELTALQSQMNPHFVFNAMNSIQSLVINNKVKEADIYLSKFANLMRQYLEGSRNKFISIDEELKIIKGYLELEQLRFSEKLRYTIQNNISSKSNQINIPSTLLQPFVENALIHGIFHKQGTGNLTIQLDESVDKINISITDDGIGRKKSLLYSSNKNRTHISRGMQLIDEKIELLSSINKMKLSYTISDYRQHDEYPGTIVNLTIEK